MITFGPSTQATHIQRDIGACAVAVRCAEREPIGDRRHVRVELAVAGPEGEAVDTSRAGVRRIVNAPLVALVIRATPLAGDADDDLDAITRQLSIRILSRADTAHNMRLNAW